MDSIEEILRTKFYLTRKQVIMEEVDSRNHYKNYRNKDLIKIISNIEKVLNENND